jgi:hypothetical protein
MKYPLTSIKSGNEDMSGIWVSIGFRSKDGEQHMLHIVGGEETNAQPVGRTLVPIYLERDDQSLSCYQGADKVLVEAASVTVTLNKVGQDALELPKTLQFVAEKAGRDFKKARGIFKEMKTRKSGEIIRVV